LSNETIESIKTPGEILKFFGESPSIQIEELFESEAIEIAGNFNESQE